MYQLIIKHRAVMMQQEAYSWYEQQKEGLGELFLKELDDKFSRITAAPGLYSKIRGQYRHVLLRKFPYVIVFRVIRRTVVVYAVFHTSRDPKGKFRN